MDLGEFERQLWKKNYAENTIIAYRYAIKDYFDKFEVIDKENLLRYKEYLIEHHKPKSVNLCICGINKYLAFLGKPDLGIKPIKTPRATFLEHLINNEDYSFFKTRLRGESDLRWYFIVWTLATTGARISELVQLKVEHVLAGHIDIYSKGGRIRRIYLPDRLRKELLDWIDGRSGFLFVNRKGDPITSRGIAQQLKELALKHGVNPDLIHPHAFRHLFALNFLDKDSDLALLADLLGHSSVETTRIYLQRTSFEQKKLINQVVDW